MKILYYRATWGMEDSLEANLVRIQQAGYDGVEMGAPLDPAARVAARRLLSDLGLDLIVQIWTGGSTPEEHARSLEEQYLRAVEMQPRLVNSQSGKDYYTTEQNATILRHADELERQAGVPLVHEVHRGRATYSTTAALDLLAALPQVRLAADFSHWCCVHESLLQDQAERMERAIERTYHIHARVGHPEGPQVNDPRAPEWKEAVETHLGWWQRIAAARRAEGAPVLTITPEFGPPTYMPALPYTRQPVANLWEINLYMRDMLKACL